MSLANAAPAPAAGAEEPTTPPKLATGRLVLRPIAASDLQFLHAAFGDRETMRFMDFPPARDLNESARYLSTYLFVMPQWYGTWAIVSCESEAVIGFVNYHHRENWNRRLEVGFMLARPCWGRGFMAEALGAVLAYCFGQLGMERIEATMNPGNGAAIRLVERLGFRYEGGPLRHRQLVGTEYRDLLIYALLQGDWRASIAAATASGQAHRVQEDSDGQFDVVRSRSDI